MSYWQTNLSIKLVFIKGIHEYFFKYSYSNMLSINLFIIMRLESIHIRIHCEVFTPYLK